MYPDSLIKILPTGVTSFTARTSSKYISVRTQHLETKRPTPNPSEIICKDTTLKKIMDGFPYW